MVEETRRSQPPASDSRSDDRLTSRPSSIEVLKGLVREVWTARDFLVQITSRDIRIRYSQSVMGFGWAVLMPALILAAGLLVRFAMAHVSGSPMSSNDISGIAIKAIPWSFFVGALGFATTSLSGNFQLVTKVAFPRIVLPVSSVLVQAFDTAIGGSAMAVLGLILGPRLDWAWLWIPLLAVLALLFTAAACIFVSCANVFFRDVKYLVQVFLTFGIFFTPVFFEPSMLGQTGGQLIMLNPLSPILEGLRLSMTGHDLSQPLWVTLDSGATLLAWTPWYLAYASVVSVFGFVGCALLFRRVEHLFAEYA